MVAVESLQQLLATLVGFRFPKGQFFR